MSDKFIRITDDFYAAPQLDADDVKRAAEQGFDLIINNRPDGEEAGQPAAAEIAAAASEAGIDYREIPIGRAGISHADLNAFDDATDGHQKVLGFCRTGTRSTTLRAFALAHRGGNADEIIADAAKGGYDLSGHRQTLEQLSTHRH
ncbi:TIGR01244 family phosphatase [Parvularcula flava]|uniref:TIGR01244 family phosphatase n=1 Tax=Aquisalinus luteolus TaxID=1566827 RepID=A0A8J3A4P1_9PROT|nr:TIGR01244 family sulfur transferase [Aquisalinus luteolus]NHK29529.1 TIGR01244 family phosphatase [Aquisalinus luteolus]GGI01664.1 TIGR01244 family protein [Aquisalinus luteolus]